MAEFTYTHQLMECMINVQGYQKPWTHKRKKKDRKCCDKQV